MKKYILFLMLVIPISTIRGNIFKNDSIHKNWAFCGDPSFHIGVDWKNGLQDEKGVVSVSFAAYNDLYLSYQKGNHLYESEAYSRLKFVYDSNLKYIKVRKRIDKHAFSFKYGYNFYDKLYACFSATLSTQLLPSYAYTDSSATKISQFFAPAYINIAPSIEYRPFFTDYIRFYVAATPINTRLHVCAVENKQIRNIILGEKYNDENIVHQYGGSMKVYLKFIKNNFSGALLTRVFFPYTNLEPNYYNVDVDFSLNLSYSITPWFSVNVYCNLFYYQALPLTHLENGEYKIVEKNTYDKIETDSQLSVGIGWKF